jgi:hypothetical protein
VNFEPMISYKYPTLASGLLPSGALSAHLIEDEIINSEDEENLSCKLQLRSRQNIERLLPSGGTWKKLM